MMWSNARTYVRMALVCHAMLGLLGKLGKCGVVWCGVVNDTLVFYIMLCYARCGVCGVVWCSK